MTSLPERLAAALQGRYRLERELGAGGMATVYLATDLRHERAVALKVLRPELATALGPERFLREIKTTAQLNHPHILPLLDSGEAAGTLFYVMPLVEGESLRDRLSRERQLPLDDALGIAREVLDALSYAHSHGIVHRDIKPENILLEGGHAVVADFGIARALSAAGGARLTETGLAIGTPAYMSPEQAAGGQDIDGRSDIYSLGCVLYEMLAGDAPYTASTPQAVIAKKLSEPLPRVSVVREAVPQGVEATLRKALARTAADRWRTAAQFSAALAAGTGSAVPLALPLAGRVRLRRLGIAVVALVAVAAGIRALTRHRAPARVADPNAITLDRAAIAVLPFRLVGADSGGQARALARSMGDLFDLKVSQGYGRRIAYPGSVEARWRAAGGTLDSALTEDAELAVGRAVGAGRLVRGTVVAIGDSLALSASLVAVATGTVWGPASARGTIGQRYTLVDRLIIQLLAMDVGASAETAPRLAQYKPEAIQAYLAAERAQAFSDEEKRYFHAALAADSNLVDAALNIYARGEQDADSAELRYAWEHQDRLTERNRAYLQVLAAGRYGSIRTMAQVIAAYDSLDRRWPEWGLPRGELADKLLPWGPLAGVPDWLRREREIFDRARGVSSWLLFRYADLAFIEEDTARARAAVDTTAVKATRDTFLASQLPSWRWRLATLAGDTTGAARLLPQIRDSSFTMRMAIGDGRGIAQAERLMPGRPQAWPAPWLWAWDRGRARMFHESLQRYDLLESELDRTTVVLQYALLLGPTADTMAADAIRRLERLASGRAVPPLAPDDQTLARCWLALWRLRHGDAGPARAVSGHLESDPGGRQRFAGWLLLFDVLLAQGSGGDVRAALLKMDSVVGGLPLPIIAYRWGDAAGASHGAPPVEVQNLILARMLSRYGEPQRALAAARRRLYGADAAVNLELPEYLREEGRLAAETGDTAGAVRAYRHYLALRENPDAPWRAAWDSVRVEYAALVRR